MTWKDDAKQADWIAAAELCAADVAFWSRSDGLELCLLCNDVFAPAADAEAVPVASVHEVLKLARLPDWRPLMQWVADRRGYTGEWFCDRRKKPQ